MLIGTPLTSIIKLNSTGPNTLTCGISLHAVGRSDVPFTITSILFYAILYTLHYPHCLNVDFIFYLVFNLMIPWWCLPAGCSLLYVVADIIALQRLSNNYYWSSTELLCSDPRGSQRVLCVSDVTTLYIG